MLITRIPGAFRDMGKALYPKLFEMSSFFLLRLLVTRFLSANPWVNGLRWNRLRWVDSRAGDRKSTLEPGWLPLKIMPRLKYIEASRKGKWVSEKRIILPSIWTYSRQLFLQSEPVSYTVELCQIHIYPAYTLIYCVKCLAIFCT